MFDFDALHIKIIMTYLTKMSDYHHERMCYDCIRTKLGGEEEGKRNAFPLSISSNSFAPPTAVCSSQYCTRANHLELASQIVFVQCLALFIEYVFFHLALCSS